MPCIYVYIAHSHLRGAHRRLLGLASLAAVHVLSCRLHACGQHGTVPMAAPAMLAHHRQLYVPIL